MYEGEVFDFSLEEDANVKQFLILVIYDVSDNKRRTKLSKMLCGFGRRVQKSAFECTLTNKYYNRLIKWVERIIIEEDYVRIYKLSANTEIITYGALGKTELNDDIYIF